MEEGLFERFPCDMVFGLHNMPGMAPGEMAVVKGPQLASSDSWLCTFRGVGTHGAKPHLGRDPITATGAFLSALQTIPGRVVDPLQPSVVSACSVRAGDPAALNVIPDVVEIALLQTVLVGAVCSWTWRRSCCCSCSCCCSWLGR